jgi:hypothetical protein
MTNARADRANEGDSTELEVLLVHEDVPAGSRAERILEQVAFNLETKTDFLVNLWSFVLLGDPVLCDRAVVDATRADIMLLSVSGCTELPATVRALLKEWLGRRGEMPGALVVSLDSSICGSAPVLDCWIMCVGWLSKQALRCSRISAGPLT